MSLKEQIKDIAMNSGVNLFGVAPPERFDGAPRGHHPKDFVKSTNSVICIGIKILKPLLEWDLLLKDSELIPEDVRKEVLQSFLYGYTGYDLINGMLDQAALKIGNFLEEEGFRTLAIPATFPRQYAYLQEKIPGKLGIFSQRHSAVRAGLGEFGLNNIVVTPQYGSRVRFASIVTEAELEPNEILKEKVCPGESCNICINECPAYAISIMPGKDMESFYYDPVSRTDIIICRGKRMSLYCYGRCIRVCPVGS